MKIPIKFRGLHKDVETGESRYVYGYFVSIDGSSHIIEDRPKLAGTTIYLVNSGSVAQLLGYDKNGEEVYEGDILEFDFEDLQNRGEFLHYEYVAHMKGFATTADGCYIPREKFKERTLKK